MFGNILRIGFLIVGLCLAVYTANQFYDAYNFWFNEFTTVADAVKKYNPRADERPDIAAKYADQLKELGKELDKTKQKVDELNGLIDELRAKFKDVPNYEIHGPYTPKNSEKPKAAPKSSAAPKPKTSSTAPNRSTGPGGTYVIPFPLLGFEVRVPDRVPSFDPF